MFKKKEKLPRRKLTKADRHEAATATAFFLPFGVLFITFTVLPVLIGVFFSFTNYTVLQSPIFVGFQNFQRLFTEDDTFLIALNNTLLFALFSGVIGFFASFIVAWIIDGLKFKKFFALAFYAPSITSGIAMSVVWLYFLSPDSYGLINHALMQMGLIDKPVLWTQNPDTILVIVVVVSVWMGMGNGFLAFLSGFQNMNREIFEAGRIDGVSNKFQELIYMVLPQMKPMLLFAAINSVTGAFSIYDVPLTLAGSPGPENAALTIVGHLNDYAFTRMDMGYATAIALVLFAITFAIGRILFRVLGTKDE